jgi:hypothetical protein
MERRHKLLPNNIEIGHHLGVLYFQAGRPEEALPLFEHAYAESRTEAIHAVNLANCLKDLGQMDRVEELSRIAYEKDNGQQWSIQLAYAESMMRSGKYRKAWPIYEKGRFTRVQTQLMVGIGENPPEWKGQKITGPLLVLGEGGWGDRINYSRFLPMISELGIKYHCMIDAGAEPGKVVLGNLFNRLPWVDRSLEGQKVDFTHWVTTFSLMAAFDVGLDNVPPMRRWYSDPERAGSLLMRSPSILDERPFVGLVWSAGEAFEGDRKVRSLTEWEAGRLVAQTEKDVHWVNLQYAWKAENIINMPPLVTWDDTALAIEACDLIVSVDTGPLHLANALGKPVWCLLSGNSDWKWGLLGQSVWYPQMRIFRNGAARGYSNSLAALTAALHAGEAAPYRKAEASKANEKNEEVVEASHG